MNSRKISSKMISQMTKQSLKASRRRNMFVKITIVLATALLMVILMFAVGQKQQIKNELSHRQQVSFYNLTDEQVEMLKKDERIAYQIQVKSGTPKEGNGFNVIPYYVSELSDKIQVGELADGSLPKMENEVAVQAAMLEKMGIAPEIGNKITLDFYDGNREEFIVSGILKGGDTEKQFPVFFSESYAKNGSQLKDKPYEVYAKLYGAATMHPEDCRELMYLVGSDSGIERKYVNPSKAFIDSLSIDAQYILIFGLVGIVILFACILVIYGVFFLSVIGRIHQFGQLRTIGMTRRQMKKLVSGEGGSLYLRSAPVSIIIGGIAGYFIIPDGFQLLNTFLIIMFVLAVIYIITMISVRRPARLAANVSPMEALRYVPQEGMQKAANKKICRSLSSIGLGMMNFSRNKKKAVITMLSLAFGGILFMAAATYMSSFDRENFARQGIWKNAEFHIQYTQTAIEQNENGMSGIQADFPMSRDFVEEISALDGVEGVTEIKNFGVKFDCPKHDEYGNHDMIYPLSEEETKEIEKYLMEGSADYGKLMSGDYILVADNGTVAEVYGWKFETGDKIILHYYDGDKTAEREVTILGIMNDEYVLKHNELEGWFLMPEQAVLNWLSYDSLNSDLLISTKADKEAAVEEALAQMIADKPQLLLETLADRRIAYKQNANRIFGAISGLAVFIMMFSILSMMNTLITNIVTRKQELAMLESIGMSKGQIRKMLLGESLFLVIATVGVTMTVGTLCGYGLSKALYRAGAFYMEFQFPVVFALAYACVLIAVPLIIILISMKSFSKESLVERLRGMED